MEELAGKVCLVTGGGSGIGLAVARAFLGKGARVAIAGRDEAKLRHAAEQLAGGERLTCCPMDVAVSDQVEAAVRNLRERWGPVEILVNNAGVNLRERSVRELTPENWRHLLRANLDGAFYCIHAVLPGMLERRDGVIINISSIAGKRPGPLGGAAYAASKFGMRALGLCLAAEEKDSGLRVCNIYPGEVDTPILEVRPQPVSEEQRRRILRPEDVAAAVLFVATLPPRVSVPELVIKPTAQLYI
jgi:NADP-dependent 3-hydroxy acid dehydrogenase YdfG